MLINIYRSQGAVRLVSDPLRGSIFISFAGPIDKERKTIAKKGERKYRWEERITMALDVNESSSIGAFARRAIVGAPVKPFQITHDPARVGGKGPQKSLMLSKSEKTDSFILSIKSENEEISVNMGYSDLYLLDTFIQSAIPQLLPKPQQRDTGDAVIQKIREEVEGEGEEEGQGQEQEEEQIPW